MAANLEYVGGKASMFYAQDTGVPWHKEGTSVETAVNSDQALTLAGQNHNISLQKIRLVDGPQIPTHMAAVRDDIRKVVGVVGSKRYKVIQNQEIVGFTDSLFSDRVALYDTGGIIDNGSTVSYWMLMRLTEDMKINDDAFANYLLIAWSHDGNNSVKAWATKVRVVCENTLNLAIGGKALVSIRHTGDIASKFDQARAVIAATTEQHARMNEWLTKLSESETDEALKVKVEENLFGVLDEATPTQRRNAIEMFRKIYDTEKERNGETAFTLVNTITGYADHQTRVTKDASRMNSVLQGSAAMFKKQGIDAVANLVGVKL